MADMQRGDAGAGQLNLVVTRRRLLGGFGLAATVGAGLTGLLGSPPASAATSATVPTGNGFTAQAFAPACSCETRCSLSVGHCGGPCSSGYWCYYCNGCGYKGNICLSGCGGASTCTWCA
jgi:hypothetical protein